MAEDNKEDIVFFHFNWENEEIVSFYALRTSSNNLGKHELLEGLIESANFYSEFNGKTWIGYKIDKSKLICSLQRACRKISEFHPVPVAERVIDCCDFLTQNFEPVDLMTLGKQQFGLEEKKYLLKNPCLLMLDVFKGAFCVTRMPPIYKELQNESERKAKEKSDKGIARDIKKITRIEKKLEQERKKEEKKLEKEKEKEKEEKKP